MKKSIYKITINNWNLYNPKHKKGFKNIMIPNNFVHDAKLRVLPVTHRWMWLGILLICSDHASDAIECSERQLRDLLESSKSVERALDAFQELQLLTYEKTTPNRIELKEKNRIEKNRKEVSADVEKPPEEKPQRPESEVRAVSTRVSTADSRGCIDEFLFDPTAEEYLKTVTRKAQLAWLNAYPNAQWICHEIRKAVAWEATNPKKVSKDRGRFMNNWLSKGFESFRKGVPSNQQTFAQKNNQAYTDLLRKNELGEL